MGININNSRHVVTAVDKKGFPEGSLPEAAFAGRSNVGKSSAINCLLRRKKLARTGASPGRTRVINFYNVDNSLMLVDLPGYGYARVSKKERGRWGNMIEEYLKSREQLKVIVLLTDIRQGATDNDVMMLDWIRHAQIPCIIAAAKADKVSVSKLQKAVVNTAGTLRVPPDCIIPLSAVSGKGRKELLARIFEAVELKTGKNSQ